MSPAEAVEINITEDDLAELDRLAACFGGIARPSWAGRSR